MKVYEVGVDSVKQILHGLAWDGSQNFMATNRQSHGTASDGCTK
jgi:hypothetical protein